MPAVVCPYLAVLVIATVVAAIGHSTGTLDAAGRFGILFAGLAIALLDTARWKQHHRHARSRFD